MNNIIPKKWLKCIKLFLISKVLRCILLLSFLTNFLLVYTIHDSKILYQNEYIKAHMVSDDFLQSIMRLDFRNFSSMLPSFVQEMEKCYFSPTNKNLFFFGSLRLIQYQYELPLICANKQETFRFSKDCNPYFSQKLSSFASKTMQTPLNRSACLTANCNEFIWNENAHVITSTKWNKEFPKGAFIADIRTKNSSVFLADFEKIHKSGWIDGKNTRILIFDFNVLENIYQTIFKFELIFEKPDGSANSDLLFTTKKYTINHYLEEDVVMTFFNPFYAISTIVFFLRNVFIYSYIQNSVYYFQFALIFIDLNYIISFIIEYSEYQDIFGKDLNANYIDPSLVKEKFYNLASLKYYSLYRIFMVTLESLVIIFKFFQLMGAVFVFPRITKFFNAFIRTLVALMNSFFSLAVLFIGWGLGFYLLFGQKTINFISFPQALMSFFVIDKSVLYNTKFFESLDGVSLAGWAFFLIIQASVFGYLLVIINFSMLKSNKIEYETLDSQSSKIQETVEQINKKIQRFSKSYLNHFENEYFTTNKKMILWLDNGLLSEQEYNDLNNLTKQMNIHLIPFYEPRQILDFLKFLFRLKPNLMYKSGNLFRILLENKEKQTEFFSYDVHSNEIIFDWLRGTGCRVPVCLYMKTKIKQNDLILLKKKYPLCIWTTNFEDIIEFCSLKNINSKKAAEKEESSFITESEESHLISRNEI